MTCAGMSAVLMRRLLREIMLGVGAIVGALAVIIPALWVVNLLFRAGLYPLLVVTVITGAALLVYQARFRSRFR